MTEQITYGLIHEDDDDGKIKVALNQDIRLTAPDLPIKKLQN
jgi:hypothetical protein